MSTASSGISGGQPSTTQPRAAPRLSPKVVTRERGPKGVGPPFCAAPRGRPGARAEGCEGKEMAKGVVGQGRKTSRLVKEETPAGVTAEKPTATAVAVSAKQSARCVAIRLAPRPILG